MKSGGLSNPARAAPKNSCTGRQILTGSDATRAGGNGRRAVETSSAAPRDASHMTGPPHEKKAQEPAHGVTALPPSTEPPPPGHSAPKRDKVAVEGYKLVRELG